MALLLRVKYLQYDDPLKLVDENGAPLGIRNGVITELGIAGHFTLSYELNEQFEFGGGLGIIGVINSKINYGSPIYIRNEEKSIIAYNHYRPILLTIPIEVTYNLKSVYFTLKNEIGLLNRFKSDLTPRENSNILTFEIGVNLN